MPNFLFQQQKGDPADKDQEEQSRNRPGQPQQQAARQRQEYVFSDTNFRTFRPAS